MAGRKDFEFSTGKDAIEMPRAGKYKLRRVLGQGRLGTVWLAHELNDDPLGHSWEEAEIRKQSGSSVAPAESDRERGWRRAKGADDLLDLALNYEHALLIARLCGPFPPTMVKTARYRLSYFEHDGELRFRPCVGPVSLRDWLGLCSPFRNAPLDLATDFLARLPGLDRN